MFARQGLSSAQISLLFLIWSVAGFAFEIPTGALADRFSRRHLIAAGQIIRGVAFLVWWVAPGFPGFATGFVLWGLEGALTSGAFQALVFDELHERGEDQDYARVMGRGEACSFAGAILGSLLAAALVPLGVGTILVLSAVTSGLAGLIVLSFPKAAPTADEGDLHYFTLLREGLREVTHRPALLAVVAFAGLVVGLSGAIEEFYGLILRDVGYGDTEISLWHAAIFAVGIGASLVAHRFARISWVRIAGVAALTGVALLTIGASGVVVAPIALLVFQSTYALQYVWFDARLQQMIATRARATVTSVQGLVIELFAVGTYLGVGFIADLESVEAGIAASGGVLVVMALVFAVAVSQRPAARRRRRRARPR